MRRFLVRAVIAIALAFAIVPTAAADTGDGGEADLGLDGITITRVSLLKSGDAVVAGTILCSQDLEWVGVAVELRQAFGRWHSISGDSWGSVEDCSATTGSAAFSVVVHPYESFFTPGRVQVTGWAEVEECSWDEEIEEDVCVWDSAFDGPTLLKMRRAR